MSRRVRSVPKLVAATLTLRTTACVPESMMFKHGSADLYNHLRRTGRMAKMAGSGVGFGGTEQLEPRLVLALNPTAEEQFMLELLNRFRANPQAELAKLTNSLSGEARSSDPDINSALDFFNVSGPVLQTQWSSLSAVPPLAWNEALRNMAELHSQNMILDDMQEHNLPGRPGLAARAETFDYEYTILGENIFAYAESILHGHAAFAIDWGSGPNGIQNPPGHRQSMLSSQFREVGIRILPETAQSTEVGPLVMTQDFGTRQNFGNSWLLGVVFEDVNDDEFYTIGEGEGGVTISAIGGPGSFNTTTFDAGGYQLQLPQGTYSVTFSGGGFGSPLTIDDVVIGSTNAKVDAIAGQAPPAPIVGVLGNNQSITPGDSTPDSADHTAFGTIDIAAAAIVRSFTVRNTGNATLDIERDPRVDISGDIDGVFMLTLDLASATIAPGEELTFQITFDAEVVGEYSGIVTILTDDATFPEFRFTIAGIASATPDVAVLGGESVAILDGSTGVSSATNTTFGLRNVVAQTSVRIYTIRNDGTASIVLNGLVRIEGEHSQDFRVIAQPALSTLAPGEFTTFTVRFNPSRVGPRSAIVAFDSNDPDTATFDFAIRGSGLGTPVINVRGNARLIENADGSPRQADATDFGRVNIENRNRLGAFVIRNVGRGFLNFTAPVRVKIMGTHADDFRLFTPPGAPIGAGLFTPFSIRFNPSEVGQRNAWVVIRTNDPATPTFTFRITGMGFETA